MDQDTVIIILVAILVVPAVIVIWFLSEKERKRRAAELSILADNLNLNFLEYGMPYENPNGFFSFAGTSDPNESPTNSAVFVPVFPLFNQGSSRTISPALIGSDQAGNYWYLFEYRYTISTGKSSTTYRFTVALVSATVAFPEMTLEPENVGFTIGKFLGMRELQVESEEFNQRYFVKTSDEKMSLDLLHPVAIECLLRQPNYEWSFSGPFAMIHVMGQLEPSQIVSMKGCIDEFLSQIPTYYRQDYGPHRNIP